MTHCGQGRETGIEHVQRTADRTDDDLGGRRVHRDTGRPFKVVG
jgi:hypothetical protein